MLLEVALLFFGGTLLAMEEYTAFLITVVQGTVILTLKSAGATGLYVMSRCRSENLDLTLRVEETAAESERASATPKGMFQN